MVPILALTPRQDFRLKPIESRAMCVLVAGLRHIDLQACTSNFNYLEAVLDVDHCGMKVEDVLEQCKARVGDMIGNAGRNNQYQLALYKETYSFLGVLAQRDRNIKNAHYGTGAQFTKAMGQINAAAALFDPLHNAAMSPDAFAALRADLITKSQTDPAYEAYQHILKNTFTVGFFQELAAYGW